MRLTIAAVLTGTALALAGCASPAQQAQSQEDLLAGAGFVQRPADTPQRRASLETLPPDRLVRTDRHGRVTYIFADPVACNCLWIGRPENYAAYQRERIRLRIANDQLAAAQMNESAAMNWNWGPWGPGWWY